MDISVIIIYAFLLCTYILCIIIICIQSQLYNNSKAIHT